MKRLNGSCTEQITSPPPETSTSTQRSAGPSPSANPASGAGSISIPESEIGIGGLKHLLTEHAQFAISLAIESYISTGLIPYLHKLSHGDLNRLLQRSVLEVRSSSPDPLDGWSYCFKYTIALCSKSRPPGGSKPLLSIPLSAILKTQSRTRTR